MGVCEDVGAGGCEVMMKLRFMMGLVGVGGRWGHWHWIGWFILGLYILELELELGDICRIGILGIYRVEYWGIEILEDL